MRSPRVFKSFLNPLFQVLSVFLSLLGEVLVTVYREVCSIRFLLTAVSLLSLFLTALWWGLLYLVPPLESRVPRARAHPGAAAAAAAGRAGSTPQGGVQRSRSQQRGASIDLEKTSRDYEDANSAYFWNRFSFWNYARPPMVILEPDVFPGNCWAFEGDQGQVVIRLPGRVQLSDITLQHPPPSVAHTGGANSAPRDFAVYGLQVDDETEVFLGKFTFDMEKSEIQTFHLQNDPPTAFPKVKIQILSNWGHPHFTCLYRVRAHGMRTSEEAGDSATGGPN
ncbi:PREDICTED: sperm-associated antigen 4 protein isoform X4 [Myotis davidii]|uniref:sperm-associated antigen 4 protein isoform X4 n=1 Tax=Myotis davidii TaxID=225400 RepID=UPI0007671582|nr:PREDICTED: sperm-associated antigen 4 protein isoform X4 [Myotis davidii]